MGIIRRKETDHKGVLFLKKILNDFPFLWAYTKMPVLSKNKKIKAKSPYWAQLFWYLLSGVIISATVGHSTHSCNTRNCLNSCSVTTWFVRGLILSPHPAINQDHTDINGITLMWKWHRGESAPGRLLCFCWQAAVSWTKQHSDGGGRTVKLSCLFSFLSKSSLFFLQE